MNSSVSETLRAFYVDNRQPLYTYAVSITRQREAAEDAIHQAFQQLLRRELLPADLRPYVFRCVRNAALDGFRRAKVQTDPVFEDPAETDPEAPGSAGALSMAELNQWLDQLSPDERETIVLKIYDDFSFQEIADLRRVPLPTATSWYRRGLAKLKALLTKEVS